MAATTAELVVAGVVGLGMGLSKDIIFSWLKVGRGGSDESACSDHREKIARIEERLETCEAELVKGDQRFKRVETILERVDKGLTVLLDRSERRREGDYEH